VKIGVVVVLVLFIFGKRDVEVQDGHLARLLRSFLFVVEVFVEEGFGGRRHTKGRGGKFVHHGVMVLSREERRGREGFSGWDACG